MGSSLSDSLRSITSVSRPMPSVHCCRGVGTRGGQGDKTPLFLREQWQNPLFHKSVRRSENPGGQVVMQQALSAPLIAKGLRYLSKSGGGGIPVRLVPTALLQNDFDYDLPHQILRQSCGPVRLSNQFCNDKGAYNKTFTTYHIKGEKNGTIDHSLTSRNLELFKLDFPFQSCQIHIESKTRREKNTESKLE